MSNHLIKILNLSVPKPKLSQLDKSKDIIIYSQEVLNERNIYVQDQRNDYPFRLTKAIQESSTASSCMDVYKRYLFGRGFSDTSVADQKINDKQKFNQIYADVCIDLSYFSACYIHVSYNKAGLVDSYVKLPFEACRLGIPDDNGKVTEIRFNLNFGKRDFRESETIVYPIFDIEAAPYQIQEQGDEFKGQVIYFYPEKKPNQYFYPFKFGEHELMNFMADAAMDEFNLNTTSNSFIIGHLLKMVGNPYERVEVGRDKDNKPIFKLKRELLEEDLALYQGVKSANTAMVMWAQNSDSFPEMQPFPTNVNADTFNAVQEIIVSRIARSTKVPLTLANIETAGKLGATQEKPAAEIQMNGEVLSMQYAFSELAKTMFKNIEYKLPQSVDELDFTIAQLRNYNVIDPNIWAILPTKNKLQYIQNFTEFDVQDEIDRLDAGGEPTPTQNPENNG